MIKLISKNNYFFAVFISGEKLGEIISGFKTDFEFQEQADGKFDFLFKGKIEADGIEFSNFTDESETPFASAEDFKQFYTASSGTNSINGLTDAELRANPIQVEAVNDASTLAKQQEIINLLTFKKNAVSVTKTNPTITTTVSTILSLNVNRKKVMFENSGNQRIFICYGQNASSTNFSFSLAQNEKFIEDTPFIGLITAITSAGSSVLQTTELN